MDRLWGPAVATSGNRWQMREPRKRREQAKTVATGDRQRDLTNAIAFSPTDAMPTALWAKGAMAVQALVSLAILSLVIARAVNVL
jgi:hypothetical protein